MLWLLRVHWCMTTAYRVDSLYNIMTPSSMSIYFTESTASCWISLSKNKLRATILDRLPQISLQRDFLKVVVRKGSNVSSFMARRSLW